MTPEPPTIAHLKGHGLEGLFATFATSPHSARARDDMVHSRRAKKT